MTNRFYNDFDRERIGPDSPDDDYRSVFRRARDRLIHNSAFRRMQAKTQVFLSGEYDFYRTRLTHSIEVSQIAGSIVGYLNHTDDRLGSDFFIDTDLCEAAGLAHDMGHPPFGHAGEAALHTFMTEYGGFEGNAQTLRLITETIFTSGSDRRGLNPPRALIDAVLKYKTLFSEPEQPPAKHFIYADQQRYIAFIAHDRAWPADLTPGAQRNQLRSLECEIMDWADDAAYSLNDLVDGAHAGFVTSGRLQRWADEHADQLEAVDHNHLDQLCRALAAGELERAMNRKIGQFVQACSLTERDTFLSDLTHRYRFGLVIDEAARREQLLYNRLAADLVFRSPQVCQLEYKGRIMLTRLFATLAETYLQRSRSALVLMSHDFEREMAALDQSGTDGGQPNAARARIICDYLAGMTDGYASRIYKRLFDPDFGSIVDLV